MLAMSDRILQMYTSNSSKLFLGSLVKKGNLVQIVILFGVSFSMIRIPTKSYFKARGGNARERWLGMDCDGDTFRGHAIDEWAFSFFGYPFLSAVPVRCIGKFILRCMGRGSRKYPAMSSRFYRWESNLLAMSTSTDLFVFNHHRGFLRTPIF